MSHHKAKAGLLLLASAGFTGAVGGGTVPHFPATATGVGCWELGALSQFHIGKNKVELLADNPLVCELKAPGSSQDWAWASPCTGCRKLTGKVDVVPAGSFLDEDSTWYVTLPDGTRAYAVGLTMHFDTGTRMVKLWMPADQIHRLDRKPLPENAKGSRGQ